MSTSVQKPTQKRTLTLTPGVLNTKIARVSDPSFNKGRDLYWKINGTGYLTLGPASIKYVQKYEQKNPNSMFVYFVPYHIAGPLNEIYTKLAAGGNTTISTRNGSVVALTPDNIYSNSIDLLDPTQANSFDISHPRRPAQKTLPIESFENLLIIAKAIKSRETDPNKGVVAYIPKHNKKNETGREKYIREELNKLKSSMIVLDEKAKRKELSALYSKYHPKSPKTPKSPKSPKTPKTPTTGTHSPKIGKKTNEELISKFNELMKNSLNGTLNETINITGYSTANHIKKGVKATSNSKTTETPRVIYQGHEIDLPITVNKQNKHDLQKFAHDVIARSNYPELAQQVLNKNYVAVPMSMHTPNPALITSPQISPSSRLTSPSSIKSPKKSASPSPSNSPFSPTGQPLSPTLPVKLPSLPQIQPQRGMNLPTMRIPNLK